MRDFWYDLGLPIAMTLCSLAMFFGLAIGIGALFESYQCSKYEAVTGKPTRYEGLSCYVQDTGSWYVWAEYKHRLVTKGDFSK